MATVAVLGTDHVLGMFSMLAFIIPLSLIIAVVEYKCSHSKCNSRAKQNTNTDGDDGCLNNKVISNHSEDNVHKIDGSVGCRRTAINPDGTPQQMDHTVGTCSNHNSHAGHSRHQSVRGIEMNGDIQQCTLTIRHQSKIRIQNNYDSDVKRQQTVF